MNALELKIPPVAVWLIVGIAMWASADYAPSHALVWPGRLAACMTLLGAAGIFGVSGVIAFRKAGTTVDPTKPHTASTTVTGGIYRYTRNPMYLALLLILVAWATYLAQGPAFVFLPMFVAYMNRFQIIPEERALRTRFGTEYPDYMRSVRRWI